MKKKIGPRLAGITLIVVTLLTGCSFPGDTSGFKPEPMLSKAQLTQQIEQVKANPKLPPGVKAMALKKLQHDLTQAK